MIFTGETEEKAMYLAGIYFTDGVLKIEKIRAIVKDERNR